jgi:hypothetical protein
MTDASTPTPREAPEERRPVFRLVYRSQSLIQPEQRKAELGRLFTQARYKNKGLGITGALLVHGDWFVQALEGDEEPVRALYEVIAGDPRHTSVTLLESGTVPGRRFARWEMARVSDDGEHDIPLIAHTDGIARAAGRPTTPEQEELLAVMRDAVRDTEPTV